MLVDAHSKWIEVHITNASAAAVTIEKLQLTFLSLGLPEMLNTNNFLHLQAVSSHILLKLLGFNM